MRKSPWWRKGWFWTRFRNFSGQSAHILCAIWGVGGWVSFEGKDEKVSMMPEGVVLDQILEQVPVVSKGVVLDLILEHFPAKVPTPAVWVLCVCACHLCVCVCAIREVPCGSTTIMGMDFFNREG